MILRQVGVQGAFEHVGRHFTLESLCMIHFCHLHALAPNVRRTMHGLLVEHGYH